MKIKKGIFYILLFVTIAESIVLFYPLLKKNPEKIAIKKDTITFLIPDKSLQKTILSKKDTVFLTPDKKTESFAQKKDTITFLTPDKKIKKTPLKKIIKKDINIADAVLFEKVFGIGQVLSKRIVKYRKILQGFSMKSQVYEVYGLDSLVVQKLFEKFEIKKLPKIKKININKATFKEILRHPYLDYEMTKKIFQYKNKHSIFKSLKKLKEILEISDEKYQKILLYLKI